MTFILPVCRSLIKCLFSYRLFFLLLVPGWAAAQQDHLLDSLQKKLSGTHTDKERLSALNDLATYYINQDVKVAEDYSRQGLELAEMSRDRQLIAITYLRNGQLHLSISSLEGNLVMARQDFSNAERVARENGLNAELGYATIGLARVARGQGNYGQALNYNHEAVSIAEAGNDDSLKVLATLALGQTYRYRNEKIQAFRSFLAGLDIAEQSGKDALLRNAYDRISEFYRLIDENDKAIDFKMKMLHIDQKNHDRYNLLDDYNSMGKLFVDGKQTEMALSMFEKAIALADSLQYNNAKVQSYLAIANMYFNSEQPIKGKDYLNAHIEIKQYFDKLGLGAFLDEGYGGVYTETGNYDSALFFFRRAEPFVRTMNLFGQCDFYQNFGNYFKKKGDNATAITYYGKAREIAAGMKDMNYLQACAANLDTLYDRSGDFKKAYLFNAEYNLYKDSIRSLAKETDMLKLEVDNDNRRRERQTREEEEHTQRRHNIQYMGFTAGLAGLFVLLVMLGFFMVSPRTIRALGFFSFIFLFEFIILLTDPQIHEMTHGEPWKVLLIKIFLAAILLPLHHWLEHTVIHYLNSRRKISAGAWLPLRKKAKNGEKTDGAAATE